MAIIIVRIVMLGAATAAGMAFGPALGIPATNWWLAGAGFLFGVLAVLLEWQARRIPVDRLFWGAMGGIVGLSEVGFLEGTLIIPQFVLRELQQIADSPDPLKRNRGKRGFDVLQRLQRLPGATVRIEDQDFPQVREVDRKLIELAKAMGGKVVTNDYNLNKVAELSGVAVLNVNELANALRPVVLPGELVHIHVVKEGKEAGQGVAYLDDGTMVGVDHGKRFIGQQAGGTVDSVPPTTRRRMVFSRLKDEEGSR